MGYVTTFTHDNNFFVSPGKTLPLLLRRLPLSVEVKYCKKIVKLYTVDIFWIYLFD